MIKHLDEGVIVIDHDLKIVYFNEPSTSITGYDVDKAIGKDIFEVFPSLDRKSSILCKAIHSKEPIIDYIQNYTNCVGKEVSILTSTIPIVEEGEVKGAIEIFKDLTHVRELSEKVLMLQNTLYEKSKDQEIFLPNGTQYTINDIISKNERMDGLKERVLKISNSSSPVFVYGETGTGKELLVQGIHNSSIRREKPFIAQNCGALPENLLESILFGTVQGSFTGAKDKPGLFELADGGTLFLDEINSMDINLQTKLLRVIENGIVRRIGSTETKHVDVRIIAASNVEPELLLEGNKLREDLYYRLNVIYFELPPLRERKEDIPLLVNKFIDKCNKKLHKNINGIRPEVLSLFVERTWSGNVRELQNAIESSMNFAEGDYIELEDLNLPRERQTVDSEDLDFESLDFDLKDAVERYEMEIIKSALMNTENNCAAAARKLNVPKQTLHGKIKRYKIMS